MDEPDDARALVERARKGDEQAWDVLYRGIYPRLLAYARRRLPSLEEAKDAVSETMTRAIAKIDRFTWDGGRGFDAWVFGILRHVVLDNQRASGRRTSVPLVDGETAEPGPLERVLGDEEAEAVRVAFSRLDPAEQELLELRVVARLSSEEAASVLGKRPGAVRTAQSRAVARLRTLMQEVADCAS